MATIEKHDAYWVDDLALPIVFERFDPVRSLILIVQYMGPGVFRGSIYEKVPDYRWTLPFWSEHKPEGLFGSVEEAQAYLNKRIEREFPIVGNSE